MDPKFLEVAKEATLEAGKIISKHFGKTQNTSVKNDDTSDLLTKADLVAEKKIIEILIKNFPEHNIISEEGTKVTKNSNYTWIIDPLDGTISFVVGLPYVTVLIGLLKDNKPILGVVYNVVAKDLFWAENKKGAYLNGKPIRVGGRSRLDSAAVAMDLGHKKARQQKFDSYVLPLKNKVGYIYSTGSSIPFGSIGKGILDAYVVEAWIWDLVAGTVIVREAGGRVTDFEGREPDWSKERLSIVASNGLIHDQIINILNSKN